MYSLPARLTKRNHLHIPSSNIPTILNYVTISVPTFHELSFLATFLSRFIAVYEILFLGFDEVGSKRFCGDSVLSEEREDVGLFCFVVSVVR